MIAWDLREDRILLLTIDDPNQRNNTLTDNFQNSFLETVDRLEEEKETYDGVILTSGKDSFIAGGDLSSFVYAGPDDLAATSRRLDSYKDAFRRLELLGRPVVAAINGTALGGGFEVTLACHRRIALDVRGSRLGLPEVTWGLLPGGGGVTRVVRMLGLDRTMADVLVEGRCYSPAEAHAVGLVDELAGTKAQMIERACAWIRANPDAAQPWDREGYTLPDAGPAADLLLDPTDPALMPAPAAVLAVATEGATADLETAFALETRHCADLICGQVSTNIIKALFLDLKQVARCGARPVEVQRLDFNRVLVVGSGRVAALFRSAAADAGVQVVTGDAALPAGCDAVVEAAEDIAACSVRFALPLAAEGEAAVAADAVVLRFTPTDRQKFRVMEILATSETSDRALAGAIDFARRLRLVPIVENSANASFTERLHHALHDEARAMIAEGTPPVAVELVARETGFVAAGLAPPPDLAATSARARAHPDLRDRLLFAMSVEALRCLDQGILGSAEEANVASVLGAGFPVWTGGVVQFVHQYDGGAIGFVARADQLREAYGDRFAVDLRAERVDAP